MLNQIKGLSEAKIDKMLEAARKLVPTMGWQSAMTYGQLVYPPPYVQQSLATVLLPHPGSPVLPLEAYARSQNPGQD